MLFLLLKILICFAEIPVWFLPIFHDRFRYPEIMPDGTQLEQVKTVSQSMAEKLSDRGLGAAFFLMAAMTASALILAGIGIFAKDSSRLKIAGNVVFFAELVLFAVLFLAAAFANRNY